jgi:hypothetical protein
MTYSNRLLYRNNNVEPKAAQQFSALLLGYIRLTLEATEGGHLSWGALVLEGHMSWGAFVRGAYVLGGRCPGGQYTCTVL